MRHRRTPARETLTVLDAQALVAALTGEPAAGEVEALLRADDERARVSAINLAETLDVLIRHQRWPAEQVIEKLRWLVLGGLDVIPVDEAVALRAGELHARHYHRTRRAVSLADCVALATALIHGEALATSDGDLLATARGEEIPIAPLLNARGKREPT